MKHMAAEIYQTEDQELTALENALAVPGQQTVIMKCDSDERWNWHGRFSGHYVAGRPAEVAQRITMLARDLGPVPDDFAWRVVG